MPNHAPKECAPPCINWWHAGGVLGGIDRATALTVLCTVVVLPLLCLR